MILFTTARTVVREMDASYLDHLVNLDSDPEVMRYINGGKPTSRNRMAEKLADWTAHYRAARPGGFWAIHLAYSDRFVGWVHLKPDWADRELDELGYRLIREVWGSGIATEVACGMIDHALHEWGRESVVARTLAANRASRRVMEKAGMRFEFSFTYPPEVLPGWPVERRAAVRYRIDT
ncbi:MAG: GNAT family N-acetyltransferase [Rhodothermales bacterium]|nr:GNAT family N-acetyltransferase [Rhodothermales bacterium]MBO6779940.1 GNAT family N-acetyltransferase [Rhodothermales bacterium]